MAAHPTSPRIVAFEPGFAAPDAAFVMTVPGADVPLIPFDLPARLGASARESVAARQVSDTIGLAPGGFELRPFPNADAKAAWDRAGLADAQTLATWREAVEQYPDCSAILPDYLALPAHPDLWVLETSDGSVRARLGLHDAFSAEPGLARRLLAGHPLPRAILSTGDAEDLADFLAETGVPVFGDEPALCAAGYPAPVRFGHAEMQFDLSRDATAERDKISHVLMAFRLPTVAAMLALGIWSAAMYSERARIERESLALRNATVDIARRALIPSGPIPDMRAQITRALAQLEAKANRNSGGMPAIALFRQAAGVIAAAGAGVTLVEVVAQPDKPLLVSINTADFARLDALIAELKQAGIATFVTESGVADTGGVNAALSLEPAERGT